MSSVQVGDQPQMNTTTNIGADGAGDDASRVESVESEKSKSPTLPSSTPVKPTPKKQMQKRRKEDSDASDIETPNKKAKADPKAKMTDPPKQAKPKRTKTKPAAGARAIARSYDECSEADKMLLDLRDAGEGWAKIRHEWEKLTGEKIGSSTLPNRYGRLKSNFTVIKEEDHGRLLEAKRNVEQAFEKGKWSMVAEAVEKMGGDKYPGEALQKQYKKLIMSGMDIAPPPGVKDTDFEVNIEED